MIELDNINYVYNRGRPDETQVLFDVSLKIPDGSVTAIIGHTGSGKSTLIQLLNGLERPTSGRVIVNGTEVGADKTDMRALRFKVGLVFQYPEQQLFEETVEKDIAFGPSNMGLGAEEIKERVKKAAQLVGIDEKYMSRSPFELSGGMKRRAAIAGVIAMEPEIIVLDEPAAGLDPAGRDGILTLIKRLHEERPDMIIIFVSHSMEDVASAADNVAVMNKGRVAMSGSVSEIFARGSELEKMGLDVPQITRLCEKLRKAGIELSPDIYTVERAVEELKRVFGNA